jgi:hypothetical protein
VQQVHLQGLLCYFRSFKSACIKCESVAKTGAISQRGPGGRRGGGFRFYLFYLKLCQTMNIISDSDTLKILLLQTTSSLNILATGLSGAHAFTFLLVQLLLLYF